MKVNERLQFLLKSLLWVILALPIAFFLCIMKGWIPMLPDIFAYPILGLPFGITLVLIASGVLLPVVAILGRLLLKALRYLSN
jgi:hypothetical protein